MHGATIIIHTTNFADFILSYAIVGLEVHYLSQKTSPVTLQQYHNSRKSSTFKFFIVLLCLQVYTINSVLPYLHGCKNVFLSWQSLTVPLQGFLNAIVYAWTKEGFLQAMGIPETDDSEEHSDMERSFEGSYVHARALEESTTISIRSTPIDYLATDSYERRRSYATDDSHYLSDHGGYNTY